MILFPLNCNINAISSLKSTEMPEILTDPLFGIQYQPSKVHFEKAPDSINRCNDLELERRELFLFGKTVKGNQTFYLLYGWMEIEPDNDDNTKTENNSYKLLAPDLDAIIVVLSPDGCSSIAAGYAWSIDNEDLKEAEKYGITKDVTQALIDDAIEREIHAFGGKAELLRKIGSSSWIFPPLVQDRLDNLKKLNK